MHFVCEFCRMLEDASRECILGSLLFFDLPRMSNKSAGCSRLWDEQTLAYAVWNPLIRDVTSRCKHWLMQKIANDDASKYYWIVYKISSVSSNRIKLLSQFNVLQIYNLIIKQHVNFLKFVYLSNIMKI